MKPKLLLGLLSLTIVLICGCDKEYNEDILNQTGAKLKRILSYASIESESPESIVAEYEYDEKGRIYKVSTPMYQNGTISGIINYDLYEYNSKEKLIKKECYNANINSPTGFVNLRNLLYTYTKDGKIEMEKIEYPQMGSYEYSLYKYSKGKLSRIEKYGKTDALESYIVNDYNNSGYLIKETTFMKDDNPISNTRHTYTNGLVTRSDVYSEGDTNKHVREIINTYDNKKRLIIKQSNELLPYSSMRGYVYRYEYF